LRTGALIFLVLSLISPVVASDTADHWFGRDKALHLLGSATLTAWTASLSEDCHNRDSQLIAVSVAFSLGCAKETSDKYLKKTYWSWKDLTYDCLGIGLGLVVANQMR
jgi:uncharacterized protein YfiM (DUF2279 family)